MGRSSGGLDSARRGLKWPGHQLSTIPGVEDAVGVGRMAEGFAAGLKAAKFGVASGAGLQKDDFTHIVQDQQSGT